MTNNVKITATLICLVLCASYSQYVDSAADSGLSDKILAVTSKGITDTGTPGAAVAVITDCRIEIIQTFGVINTWSGRLVSNTTVFDAASLGKPVTALLTLLTSQLGNLSLDEPRPEVYNSPDIWPRNWAKLVTIRQLLSHSGGLPNKVWEPGGKIRFKPGSDFKYSGNGYNIIGEILTGVHKKSFEEIFHELIFNPLQLTNSSFASTASGKDMDAYGHVKLGAPLMPYLKIFILIVVPLAVISSFIITWAIYRSCLIRQKIFTILIVAGSLSAIYPFYSIFGRSALVVWGCLALCHAFIFITFYFIVSRMANDRAPNRILSNIISVLIGSLILVACAHALKLLLIPVPAIHHKLELPSSSFRTSIFDLAKLTKELTCPTLLNSEFALKMQVPEIMYSDEQGWTLGLGWEIKGGRETLWQWGDNPGSQSLIVIDRLNKRAVAILTNGYNGITVARAVAQAVVNHEGRWSIDPDT